MTVFDDYVRNPQNPMFCANVAIWYENQSHFGPAAGFYLRCSEFSDDKTISYNGILKAALCFEKLQGRQNTVKVLLQNAIILLPKRPEAYFLLSRNHERNLQWQDCYTNACLGIAQCDNDFEQLPYYAEYPGEYALYFEKAVSAWWWGKGEESRKLFRWIADEYWDIMDQSHKDSVENNMGRLGSGPESQAIVLFDPDRKEELRFKFNGYKNLERNYSQVMQDLFVISMTNGKRNGTFVEVGGAFPFNYNNTALLEKGFDWKGISIEYDEKFIDDYRKQRSAKLYHTDALTIDYEQLFKDNFDTNEIDYLQLDIEPCRKTYQCLEMIPFDKYKFAVITFEHDYYVDPTREFRDRSRKYLESKGYVLVVNDVSPDGKSNFEDWWVHPDLVDLEILEKMKQVDGKTKFIPDYFYQSSGKGEQIPVNFKLNPQSKNTVWVVDDFYEDPDAIREFALQQEYHQGGRGRGYIGRRTFNQFLFPGLKERFENIVGRKISKWEEHGMNGRFQTCWGGDPLVYHCDFQKWGGMIYLTPDAPYQAGTSLCAHKTTRIRHSSHPEIMSVFEGENLDGTLYEPVDVIGNVYNRLVIFDAHCIHNASDYFGHNPETGRLWHMFFFDTYK